MPTPLQLKNCVDLIVPCHNYGRFLEPCLRSILTQEGVNVRVLIIDDASDDNTAQVAQRWATRDQRIQFRRHSTNKGPNETFNEGLDWASAEYMLLISADDMLTPGALARATSIMHENPDVGFTHGRAIRVSEPKPGDFRLPPDHHWCITRGEQFIEACCRAGDNIVQTPTAVVRTALQKTIGNYRLDLVHTGDMEMWMRFAAHGAVACTETHQAWYRTHGLNLSAGFNSIYCLQQRKMAFDITFANYAHRLQDSRCLSELAYHCLAEEIFWKATHIFAAGEGKLARQHLDLAAQIDPRIVRSLPWRRLRLKRLIGARAWSVIVPLIHRLRQPSTRTYETHHSR